MWLIPLQVCLLICYDCLGPQQNSAGEENKISFSALNWVKNVLNYIPELTKTVCSSVKYVELFFLNNTQVASFPGLPHFCSSVYV